MKIMLPIVEILLDVYQYKKTDIATQYSLHTQSQVMEFNREYPEGLEDVEDIKECSSAIGFKADPDYYEYDDDFEDKKRK